jgi:hypothetical protein
MTVLDEILAAKRDEVTVLHRPGVGDLLRSRALDAPPTRDSRRSSAGPRRRATWRRGSTPG